LGVLWWLCGSKGMVCYAVVYYDIVYGCVKVAIKYDILAECDAIFQFVLQTVTAEFKPSNRFYPFTGRLFPFGILLINDSRTKRNQTYDRCINVMARQ
jgi:hypothetical protein